MKVFISILALSVVMLSCKKDSDNNQPPPGNGPIENSQWVYKSTTYNEGGSVIETGNITLNAVAATIGGSTWLNMVDQSTGQPIIAIQKRTEGWWYNAYPDGPPSLWFKYPAAVNETYPYAFGTCLVKEINASVTVPAGSFSNCYMVEGDDSNSKEDEFWFSKDGAILIKFNTYDEKAAGPATNLFLDQSLELVSFTR